jgi:hypothetical protein
VIYLRAQRVAGPLKALRETGPDYVLLDGPHDGTHDGTLAERDRPTTVGHGGPAGRSSPAEASKAFPATGLLDLDRTNG